MAGESEKTNGIPRACGDTMTPLNTLGEIITFYSYKGGTGRSMALSNVACLLAERDSEGKGVLMIDWDLEAPGLHIFFHNTFQRISVRTTDPARTLEGRPGLTDLFLKLDAATPVSGVSEEETEMIAYNTLNNIKLEEFIVETDIHNLSLLKAGRFDENFSNN